MPGQTVSWRSFHNFTETASKDSILLGLSRSMLPVPPLIWERQLRVDTGGGNWR